jgi:hypothetical protein
LVSQAHPNFCARCLELFGDELEDAFPDQAIGQEFARESPIWKVIEEEAVKRDKDRFEVWDKTLDVHLVFVRSPSPVYRRLR